jgi:hypothetical protein
MATNFSALAEKPPPADGAVFGAREMKGRRFNSEGK